MLGKFRLGLYSGYELWRLQLFSFCGYGLALAALALMTATRLDNRIQGNISELTIIRKDFHQKHLGSGHLLTSPS